MAVRPLAETDIPKVADLYWSYMRRRSGSPSPEILSLFHELFVTNPFLDPEFPSLVYENSSGKLGGFLGRMVRKMAFGGKLIRVLFGGNLVVHPEFRSGLAAARLVNTFLSTPYDLSMTDSANNISKDILQRMGYDVVPAMNIHWRRPLRPSHYAVFGLSMAAGNVLSASVRAAAKPFCSVADGIAGKLSASPFRQNKSHLRSEDLDVPTLLQCMTEFRDGYSLWPEYDLQSLQWLISFMERRRVRGELRKVLVRDDTQKIVGWYVYYVSPGAVGEVVQIGGDLKYTKEILDHLFWDAQEHGVIGLHGMVDSRRMPDFSDKGCFFTCRGGWTVVSSPHPELMKLIERGDALFSRLDGEWCLDPGD